MFKITEIHKWLTKFPRTTVPPRIKLVGLISCICISNTTLSQKIAPCIIRDEISLTLENYFRSSRWRKDISRRSEIELIFLSKHWSILPNDHTICPRSSNILPIKQSKLSGWTFCRIDSNRWQSTAHRLSTNIKSYLTFSRCFKSINVNTITYIVCACCYSLRW